ncbi:MAG TPA: DUF5655 domain-containing protein [Bryobacteraceae bacterium]|nr:DUF5655 domain-containing protein [Bryobacteraceae bacterium]
MRCRLADHFQGKDSTVRDLFESFRQAVEACGPVSVYAQKTRIVFQVRARFAGAAACRRWPNCGLWLKRRATHPLIRRVEFVGGRDYIHHFRLTEPGEIDDGLRELIREAYLTGAQQYGSQPKRSAAAG